MASLSDRLRFDRLCGTTRGQSELVGAVLILGLTLTGSALVVAYGSSALTDAERNAQIGSAEHAMTRLDAKASLTAHGSSQGQVVSLGTGGQRVSVDGDAGWIRIEVETEEGDQTLNRTMGTITYVNDDTTIAYQGGGVWRSEPGGSVMVSPPEFHYRGDTLTLPLIAVAGDGHLGDRVALDRSGQPVEEFPSGAVSNPLVGGNVTIVVQSEYSEAWGSFFEARTDANVTEVTPNRVEIVLPTEVDGSDVTESMAAIGADSQIDLQAVDQLYADSYDSDAGGPEDSKDNAVIWSDGDVESPRGGGSQEEYVTIRGDLLTSGSFSPNENSFDAHGAINVTGETISDAARPPRREVTGVVQKRIGQFEQLNLENEGAHTDGDNVDGETFDEDTYVDGDLQVDDGVLRIQSDGDDLGVEVTDDLEIGGNGELVVDTAEENTMVHLGIGEDLLLEGGDDPANMTVRGDGILRIYVGGDVDFEGWTNVTVEDDAIVEIYHDSGDVDLVAGDGNVTTTVSNDEAAGQFWLFSTAEDVTLDGSDSHVEFTGVLYAPDAEVEMSGDITVLGSVVVDSYDIEEANVRLRFDEAITQYDPLADETIPTVNHLYVSVYTVNVTASS